MYQNDFVRERDKRLIMGLIYMFFDGTYFFEVLFEKVYGTCWNLFGELFHFIIGL